MNQKKLDKRIEDTAYIVKELALISMELSRKAKEKNFMINSDILFSGMISVFSSMEETPEKS